MNLIQRLVPTCLAATINMLRLDCGEIKAARGTGLASRRVGRALGTGLVC